MYPTDVGCLTESPPGLSDHYNLLRIDAQVVEADDDSVTLVTAVDATIIMPRSVFERRDCTPTPRLLLSFDLQCWMRGRYMSRLMVGTRFSGPSEENQP